MALKHLWRVLNNWKTFLGVVETTNSTSGN